MKNDVGWMKNEEWWSMYEEWWRMMKNELRIMKDEWWWFQAVEQTYVIVESLSQLKNKLKSCDKHLFYALGI